MRNIYEDGTNRPQEQPLQSGQQEQPTLTKEQIDALLQYLANQQAQQDQSPPPAEQGIPAQPLEGLPEGVDTGTRILYQSPDFEKKELPEITSVQEETLPLPTAIDSEAHFQVDDLDAQPEKPHFREAVPLTSGFSTFDTEDDFDESEAVEEIPLPPGELSVEAFAEIPEEEHPAVIKKKKTKKIIRTVVLSICGVAILASLGVLLREFLLHKDNQAFENEVTNMIITDVDDSDNKVGNSVHLTEEQQWEQIRQAHPNIIFPKNMQLKYANFYATNTDFVGYLEAPGTSLHIPVVQTRNDTDYLYKNFYGNGTKYGCPFVSCLNKISTLDMNTVIYGHHMNDGSIFGSLDKYKRLDGYKAAPIIHFDTLYADYTWKVIGAFISNSYAEDDNGYVFNYFFPNLSSSEKMASYLNEVAQRSLYDTGVDVLPSDKLLTLSTCSHEFENARFVVVARLVREGESEVVDTSKAVANNSPRYPQAYYTKRKQNNPYANASRWFVG